MRVAAAVVVAVVAFWPERRRGADRRVPGPHLVQPSGFQPGYQACTDDGTFTLYDESRAADVSAAKSRPVRSWISVPPCGSPAAFDRRPRHASARQRHRTTVGRPARRRTRLFFNRPRPFTATVGRPGSASSRPSTSASAICCRSASEFDMHVFAGPVAVPLLEQEVVDGGDRSPKPALHAVTAREPSRRGTENTWGAHFGADVSYPVYQARRPRRSAWRLPALRRGGRRISRS